MQKTPPSIPVQHSFCDRCPDCRPQVIDSLTDARLPEDFPIVRRVDQVWRDQTTYYERKAFIEATRHHCEDPETIRLAKQVSQKFANALNRGSSVQ